MAVLKVRNAANTGWIEIGGPGPQGIQGDQGYQGDTGDQGPQGNQGNTGSQGATGAQGATGSQGATGAQGPIGNTGAQGPQGYQGYQGNTGAQGPAGVQGATGSQGPQGEIGPQGSTGAQGTTGAQGSTGAQGPQGNQGVQGPQGYQGDQGATGATGTCLWTSAGGDIYPTASENIRTNANTFEVSNATGVATWAGAGTVGISGGDLLVASTASDLVIQSTGVLYFKAGGANTRWVINAAGHLYMGATDTYTLGLSTRRCKNVYSVLGNFSGDVTTGALIPTASGKDIATSGNRYRNLYLSGVADFDSTLNVQGQGTFQANVDFGAGIDVTGNITVTGQVDGVDISAFKTAYDAHKHTISGNTGNTIANLTGDTTGAVLHGSVDYNGNPLRISASGAVLYMDGTGHLTTSSGGNTPISIGAHGHHHVLTGTQGHVTLYTATCTTVSHLHASGTLVNGTPS